MEDEKLGIEGGTTHLQQNSAKLELLAGWRDDALVKSRGGVTLETVEILINKILDNWQKVSAQVLLGMEKSQTKKDVDFAKIEALVS